MKLKHQLFVFLFAILAFGCSSENNLQGDLDLPSPDFTVDNIQAQDGQLIQFTDLSEGALGWEWNFGDGSDSSFEQNPTHAYLYGGEYTVTLTVWNNDGENLVIKENYIKIDGPEKEKPSLPELFSYTVVTTSDHKLKGLPGFVGEIYINDQFFAEVVSATTEITIPAASFSGNQDVVFLKGEWTDGARVLSIGNNTVANTDIVALNKLSGIKVYFGRYLKALQTIDKDFFAACPELTTLTAAFRNCINLKTIPGDLFKNNPEVTNFQHVFADCTFEVIPAGLFDNNTKVTTFASAFNVNTAMKEVPAGLFANCPLVTNFSYAFYKNSNLTTIPSGLFDSCVAVTNFEGIFAACNITTIPNGFFDKNTKVSNFKSVFNLNKAITVVPTTLFDNCKEVTTFASAFYGCTGLTAVPSLWEQTFPALTTTTGCFQLCSNISNYNSIPSTWK